MSKIGICFTTDWQPQYYTAQIGRRTRTIMRIGTVDGVPALLSPQQVEQGYVAYFQGVVSR
jgi:hypothetical protein